jgi:hypothetical protein
MRFRDGHPLHDHGSWSGRWLPSRGGEVQPGHESEEVFRKERFVLAEKYVLDYTYT